MAIKKVALALVISLLPVQAHAVQDGAVAKGNPNVVSLFALQNGTFVYRCTGAYIRERIIATASHCIDKNSQIYVSDTGVDVSESPTRTPILSFAIPNPELAPWNNTYPGREQDIAFLFTEKPLSGNPLTIASRQMVNSLKSDGATVVAYGYGNTAYRTPSTGMPYSYTLLARHRDVRSGLDSERYMSAVGIKGATCPGDSGGPILSGNYLVGIVFGGGTWTCHNGTIHVGTWSTEATLVWPYEEYLEREYKAFLDSQKPKPIIKKRKWRR